MSTVGMSVSVSCLPEAVLLLFSLAECSSFLLLAAASLPCLCSLLAAAWFEWLLGWVVVVADGLVCFDGDDGLAVFAGYTCLCPDTSALLTNSSMSLLCTTVTVPVSFVCCCMCCVKDCAFMCVAMPSSAASVMTNSLIVVLLMMILKKCVLKMSTPSSSACHVDHARQR